VKNAYAQRPGDLQGYGQAFVQSNDQKLDWADMFVLYTQPIQARDMSYWPSQPHTFRLVYFFPSKLTFYFGREKLDLILQFPLTLCGDKFLEEKGRRKSMSTEK
jgi:hypothetical protein